MARYVVITVLLSVMTVMSLQCMQSSNLGWNGAQYDQASDRQFQAGKMLLNQMEVHLGKLEPNAVVLELGCGTGRLAAEIAQNHVPSGKVIGVDSCQSMINEANKRQEVQSIENLSFELQDARALNFDDETFDACISVFCLHWIYTLDDMRSALNHIAQTLKPGGKFAAIFNIPDSEEHPFLLQRAARNLIRSDEWSQFYVDKYSEVGVLGNEITLQQYKHLLQEVGLLGEVSVQNVGVCNMTKEVRIATLSILPAFKAVTRELEEQLECNRHGDSIELIIETERKLENLRAAFIKDIFTEFDKLGMKNDDGTYKQCTPVGMIIAQKPS